mgnify:CR=1 FL=1
MKKVKAGSVVFSNDMPISIMAGPCVIESRDHIHHMAGSIAEVTRDLGIGSFRCFGGAHANGCGYTSKSWIRSSGARVETPASGRRS